MFSGGRDSTLSAVRLARQGHEVILVTVTSAHLVGIAAVRKRLVELKSLLPDATKWVQVRQPEIPTGALLAQTCLPCHRSYAAVGGAVAHQHGSEALAFGYTQYQADWAEQTPYAVERLREALVRGGLRLLTPVYDVASKDCAIRELRTLGLSASALEQKCLQQQFNLSLPPKQLRQEIDHWAKALELALSTIRYDPSLLMADLRLADL
jgi:hypothetical protein